MEFSYKKNESQKKTGDENENENKLIMMMRIGNMFDVPNQNGAWEDDQIFEGDLNSRKYGGKTKKRKFRGKKSQKNRRKH